MGQSLSRPRHVSSEARDESGEDLFRTKYPMVGQGYVRRLKQQDDPSNPDTERGFGFFSVDGKLLAAYHDELGLMVSASHRGFKKIHRVH